MDGERNALFEELHAIERQLSDLRRDYMARPMPFGWPRQFEPLGFLFSVILLYFSLGALGVWLIFDRGSSWADLGIGLLVGALFGIGSLIAAMWEAAFNWWSGFMNLEYESKNDSIRQWGRRALEIEERLAALNADDDTTGGIG